MSLKEKWNELDKQKKILVGVGSAVAIAAVGAGVVSATMINSEVPNKNQSRTVDETERANKSVRSERDEKDDKLDDKNKDDKDLDVNEKEDAKVDENKQDNEKKDKEVAINENNSESKATQRSSQSLGNTPTATVKVQKSSNTGSTSNSNNSSNNKKQDTVTTKTTTVTESIPFETQYQNDPNLEKGKEVVVQNGQNGTRTITYKETYVNGKLTNKEQISSKVTKNPVNKIVKRGTKEQSASLLPASQAKSILQSSPLKSSADGTQFYYVDTEYPEVIRVFVGGNNVTKIMWNPMAYNTRNVSKQELVELLGADYAEEVYQYNKKVRSEIESAVRAAANAVYGSGTSKANQLYSQIINTLSQHKTFTF